MTSAAHTFLPWVRQGVLTGLATPDTLDRGLASRAHLPVTIRLTSVTRGAPEIDGVPIEKKLSLYGPGDVIGIDPREIVRTDPRHLTPDFPSNLFPTIEFVRADFPWLFTPAAPNGDRLRPWIVLIAVEKHSATLTVDPGRPLPMLECSTNQLPNLIESWLWAHAQFTGAVGEPVKFAQTVSRLMCPRRLEPSGGTNTGYLACLVPAFDVGRKAGLGEPITVEDEKELRRAWDVGTQSDVRLPVYYSWEFATAAPQDDFGALVDRFIPRTNAPRPAASEKLKPVVMDVSNVEHPDLDPIPGATLGVLSALHAPGVTAPGWPDSLNSSLVTAFATFQGNLKRVLETPPGAAGHVSPPIYGSRQASGSGVVSSNPLGPDAPRWLPELNLNPQYRVAAALGAQVVQQQQEQLVTSAWRQAGQIADANQWLRQKQLAREVTRSVFENRLKVLTPESLQQITAPAAAPIDPSSSPSTGASQDALPLSSPAPSPLSEAIVSAPFRRVARPLGPLARRAAAPVMEQPAGGLSDAIGPRLDSFTDALDVIGLLQTPSLKSTGDADFGDPVAEPPPAGLAAAPADESAAILTRLDPSVTFRWERYARVKVHTLETRTQPSRQGSSDRLADAPATTDGLDQRDSLAPVQLVPTFPQPMYEPLRDLFRDMLLPGLDALPNNTILLLRPDPKFIEAYMVGLNDELNRELLWREFPTNLRGTYFRQFWDVRSELGPEPTEEEWNVPDSPRVAEWLATRERLRDIPPIAGWSGELGSNMKPERGQDLVFLLIKGDLLLRFPTALIFAARSNAEGNQLVLPSLQLYPIPGVRLLGFNIKGGDTEFVGDPGWYFVFQEHPTEPHFGLNVELNDERDEPLSSWRELAWSDIALQVKGGPYIRARLKIPTTSDTSAKWNNTAADMAYITLQKAYRLEVHAGVWKETWRE